MKIWCTFYSAGSLQSRGLEHVQVWFAQPEWIIESRQFWFDSPFGDPKDHPSRGMIERSGWFREYTSGEKYERQYFSFGKVFGYGDSEDPQMVALATYVWGKICEFYDNGDFLKWNEFEQKGRETSPQKYQPNQFLLEVDLDIVLRK